MKTVPYLNFNGNCREAFQTYAEVLGGKIEALVTFGETPAAEGCPAQTHDQVMHACMTIGEDGMLMASDCPPEMYLKPQAVYVSIHPETVADCERIYNALSPGGEIVMPLQATFWSTSFAMFTDRFGTPWMINCAEQPAGAEGCG